VVEPRTVSAKSSRGALIVVTYAVLAVQILFVRVYGGRCLARIDNPGFAEILLVVGADPERALDLHAYYGHDDMVRVLLEHGADIEGRHTKWDDSPLVIAFRHGHMTTAKILIDHGADLRDLRWLVGSEPSARVRELDEAVPEPGLAEDPAGARGADLALACEAAE
jgi:hypothetical protein